MLDDDEDTVVDSFVVVDGTKEGDDNAMDKIDDDDGDGDEYLLRPN